MKEIWKNIDGYDGKYQVSNKGRIKSFHGKTKIRKPAISGRYYMVTLSNNGVVKVFNIHRLVAITFLPNPNNYPVVNHKDHNPLNNDVRNLEWCTQQYNSEHGNAKHYRFIKNGEVVNVYNLTQFCKKNNLNIGGLWAVAVGRKKQYLGFESADTNYIRKKNWRRTFLLKSPEGKLYSTQSIPAMKNIDKNINLRGLSKVVQDKRKSHKGWTCYLVANEYTYQDYKPYKI